MSSRM